MKRVLSVILCVCLIVVLFAGCGSKQKLILIDGTDKIKIGLICFDDDEQSIEMKTGFETALKNLEYYGRIEVDYRNADGDDDILRNICSNIFKNNDLVVTIGKTASVMAKNMRDDATKPIFFIGVRNPVTSLLMTNTITPSSNITGIMSNVTPDCVFSFASEKIGGQLRKVGIIYNTSEINPSYEVNELKNYLNSNSILYVEGIIANVFDAQQATLEILGTKVPSQTEAGVMENVRTTFVISSDEVTKKSIPGIASLVKNTGSVAFVMGDAQLPNEAFFSIVPVYESLGRKCVNLVNDYINGTSVIAISAQSSDEYNLFQGEPVVETEVPEGEQIQ